MLHSFPMMIANSGLGGGGHIIEGSGLFDGSSGFLSRTQGTPTNRKVWSVEFIVKHALLGSSRYYFGTTVVSGGSFWIEATAAGLIDLRSNTSSGVHFQLKTTQVFRDPSAFLHILYVFDSTQSTANNRQKLYINGTKVTSFTTQTDPSLNYEPVHIASGVGMRVGHIPEASSVYNNDYFSRAAFYDGQALVGTDVGEVTGDGFWQINDASELTFGTNGFLLEGGTNVSRGTDTQAGGTFAQQKTEFLSHFDGSDAATSSTDVSLAARTLTFNGNAQLDTAQKYFGTASLLLDGTADSVSAADNPAYDIAALDFTMDAWIRLASDQSGTIMSKWGSSGQWGWLWTYDAGSSLLDWRTSTNGSNNANQVNETWNPSLNTWYHVAAERTGGKVHLYVDGTMLGSGDSNSDTVYANTAKFEVGACENSASVPFHGHIDEPRFVLGVGLYGGSNFTPETAAYTDPATANHFTKTGTITATNDSPTNGDA